MNEKCQRLREIQQELETLLDRREVSYIADTIDAALGLAMARLQQLRPDPWKTPEAIENDLKFWGEALIFWNYKHQVAQIKGE